MRSRDGLFRSSACVGLVILTLSLAIPSVFAAERAGTGAPVTTKKKLQLLVKQLKTRLSIPAAVSVSIVARNPLMMSIEAPKDQKGVFLLAIDAAFLGTLTDDELEAAIAHELGHVWVFTHHPYLQTEELANQIAMRAVSRQSLEQVYAKVWERGGTKGDLARFLGSSPSSPASPAIGLASETPTP